MATDQRVIKYVPPMVCVLMPTVERSVRSHVKVKVFVRLSFRPFVKIVSVRYASKDSWIKISHGFEAMT